MKTDRCGKKAASDEKKDAYPVFRGLMEMGVTETDLTEALAASHANVMAWRRGEKKMPPQLVAVLTEFLDGIVKSREADVGYAMPIGKGLSRVELDCLSKAQDGLQQQRAFNRAYSSNRSAKGRHLFENRRRRNLDAIRQLGREAQPVDMADAVTTH